MLAARASGRRQTIRRFFEPRRRRFSTPAPTGTSLIGDVTNTLAAVPLLRDAKMPACVFHELIGFAGINADEQVAAARHAIDALPSTSTSD